MKSGKTLLLAAMLGAVGGIGQTATAAPLKVAIFPAGSETFIEDTRPSGQIVWSAEEDLVILAGQRLSFAVSFDFTDTDNVPVDPWVSELSLVDWPAQWGATMPWTFWWFSSSLHGPRNTWAWHASAVLDTQVTFEAGENIATAAWETGGDDIDDTGDDSSLRMLAGASVMTDSSSGWLTLKRASDNKDFNPEPVPEPAVLSLVAFGAFGILRRGR